MHVYDFGPNPAEFSYNGLPMHRVKRIEYSVEYEAVHSHDTYISSVMFNVGYWQVYLEDGKTYTWPQEGVLFNFMNTQTETGQVYSVHCRAQEGIHPKVTDTKETIEHNPAATVWTGFPGSTGLSRRDEVSKLPGIEERVTNPVTGEQDDLEDVIIDLNDSQKWTRHQIADWLETLDIDIRFKTTKE